MPLARIGQSILYFAHIPKTGGSSIEAYIRHKGSLSLLYKQAVGGLRTSPQHLQAALFDTLVPHAFYNRGFAVLGVCSDWGQSDTIRRLGYGPSASLTV